MGREKGCDMNGAPFAERATNHLTQIDKTNGALCALGQLLNAADIERMDLECFLSSFGDLLEVLATANFEQTDDLRKLVSHLRTGPTP